MAHFVYTGLKANLPEVRENAFYLCTDTREIYFGADLFTEAVRTYTGEKPATPATGVLYVNTDTKVGEIWTGSAWVHCDATVPSRGSPRRSNGTASKQHKSLIEKDEKTRSDRIPGDAFGGLHGTSAGRNSAAALGVCDDSDGYAVRFHPFYGQYLSGHRSAVGHELLDAPDGQDGRRLGLHLRGAHAPRPETDAPALAVDQRLRTVFGDARARERQAGRGVAAELVLAPVGDGQALLLFGLPGRPRHQGRGRADRACRHHALHLPREQRERGGDRCLRPRVGDRGDRRPHHRRIHHAQQRRCARELPQLFRDDLRQALQRPRADRRAGLLQTRQQGALPRGRQVGRG